LVYLPKLLQICKFSYEYQERKCKDSSTTNYPLTLNIKVAKIRIYYKVYFTLNGTTHTY
jgi:hypothetical protein